MLDVRHPASGLRTLVGVKLGRCPSCMRGAARGTVVAWVVAATVYLTWPDPRLLAAVLIVTAAFTLLLAAHLSVYGVREARRARAATESDGEGGEVGIDRRHFLGRAATAAAGAAFAALALPALARGQLEVCHCPRGCRVQVSDTGLSCAEVRGFLVHGARGARVRCAQVCLEKALCAEPNVCANTSFVIENFECSFDERQGLFVGTADAVCRCGCRPE